MQLNAMKESVENRKVFILQIDYLKIKINSKYLMLLVGSLDLDPVNRRAGSFSKQTWRSK